VGSAESCHPHYRLGPSVSDQQPAAPVSKPLFDLGRIVHEGIG
jgi:hypothetical protein